MSDERLMRLLQASVLPDELGAERRSWAVVRSAYEEAEVKRERRWPTRPLLALAALLALVAAAFSPPGAAVVGWVRAAVATDPRDNPRPGLASLPSRGSLLVTSERGPWIVRQNGSKRLLGAYDQAVWSPRGLHVAVTRGTRLVAVTANGDVRWTITRAKRVRDPLWSPSGFRIAYRVGSTLHVVSADSSPDRVVARGVTAVAWRPSADHVLAYADRVGRVHAVNTDTRRTLWRSRRGCAQRLAWSAEGDRLLAACPRAVRVLDDSGQLLRRDALVTPSAFEVVAFAPEGRTFAYTARTSRAGEMGIFLEDAGEPRSTRKLFETKAEFADLAWSPDGRWLLVTWPAADQWIFVRTSGSPKIVTISNVSAEFDPGGSGAAPFPSLSGWCCPRYVR